MEDVKKELIDYNFVNKIKTKKAVDTRRRKNMYCSY